MSSKGEQCFVLKFLAAHVNANTLGSTMEVFLMETAVLVKLRHDYKPFRCV